MNTFDQPLCGTPGQAHTVGSLFLYDVNAEYAALALAEKLVKSASRRNSANLVPLIRLSCSQKSAVDAAVDYAISRGILLHLVPA